MRETARDLCTGMIGQRTREEIALDRDKELSAPRYTRLDETITGLCGGTFRLDPGRLATGKERILARLETLRKMKLCVYQDGEYRLSAKWREDLRANGRYNTYLESRRLLRYASPSELRVYSGETGTVSGKVTKIFRLDGDASDHHAVLLEGLDGKAYFAPLLKKPEVYRGKEKAALAEGDLITMSVRENQRGRLTPVLFTLEAKAARREIVKNRYEGKLAKAVLDRTAFAHRRGDENSRGRKT
jgi:hypothetical protein